MTCNLYILLLKYIAFVDFKFNSTLGKFDLIVNNRKLLQHREKMNLLEENPLADLTARITREGRNQMPLRISVAERDGIGELCLSSNVA